MSDLAAPVIRIAAAVIDDGAGRLLVVRKAGSKWFMLAGGKIEKGEQPVDALKRELAEEVGFVVDEHFLTPLGSFSAPAANEAGAIVTAELFHFRTTQMAKASAEIAEALWVAASDAASLPLAPLMVGHVLPLVAARGIVSAD
ncbi:NUDIX hydrolase [Acetobacter nitrogenifigens]|uniref:DNA mismatch repair protein MutT n=1 Tax=Acetobacter nitrogenifigens DSM 23921 = NBRC 105050 TaxID=1120919 RepID=A0A511X670_9PROT|nr:NUDIX domain-containing protein [Acetobacter nitrogenifigens]GEN58431.1 DNA mismatch repair protein MutT [Acetobacter nitrogenifigens DSM 23921 = NBRC 105050]